VLSAAVVRRPPRERTSGVGEAWTASRTSSFGSPLAKEAIHAQMGHSSVIVTLNRYGNLFPQLDEAIAEAFGAEVVEPERRRANNAIQIPRWSRRPSAELTGSVLSIQCVDMERKDKVLNLRVSDRQRTMYERAAALEGVSVSALVTSAADDRADEVLHTHASMTVPADVFDDLLAALDRPAVLAPPLEKALNEPRYENR
jgi:uncharacterized protein (DUF1778 family)